MNDMNITPALLVAIAIVSIGGCDNGPGSAASEVRQTGFPGQVTAGGTTSGEIMARTAAVTQPKSPAGTPGIPQGAGGNRSGAGMGGTTSGTASSQTAPPPGGAPPSVPPQESKQ